MDEKRCGWAGKVAGWIARCVRFAPWLSARKRGDFMPTKHILLIADDEPSTIPQGHVVLPPSEADLQHVVFAETMLEDTSTRQRRSPLDWVAAIGVHFAVLAMLLILPLYYTAGLDTHKLSLMFLAAPPLPAAAAPPPMVSSAALRPSRPVPSRPFNPT
jgi:hypothetical protein